MAKYEVVGKAFINGKLYDGKKDDQGKYKVVDLDIPKEHSLPSHLRPAKEAPKQGQKQGAE